MVTTELFKDFFCENDRVPAPASDDFWTLKTENFFETLLGLGLCIEGGLIEGYILAHWQEEDKYDICKWTGFNCGGDEDSIFDCGRWFVLPAQTLNLDDPPIFVMVWQKICWGDEEIFFPDQTPVRVYLDENGEWKPVE